MFHEAFSLIIILIFVIKPLDMKPDSNVIKSKDFINWKEYFHLKVTIAFYSFQLKITIRLLKLGMAALPRLYYGWHSWWVVALATFAKIWSSLQPARATRLCDLRKQWHIERKDCSKVFSSFTYSEMRFISNELIEWENVTRISVVYIYF